MKKTLTLLLAAAMLCVFLTACVVQPADPTTEPTVTTQPTTAPITIPTTEPATEPLIEPTLGENVTPPDEMPERPENDYSLPPDERPGDRNEVIDR